MNAFSSLSAFWQTMFPLVFLVEAVLELGLFLYQVFRSRKKMCSFFSAGCFALLVMLLFSVTQGDPDGGKDAFLLGAPWGVFAAVMVLAAIHFGIALPREYRRRKRELSPFSIKEATDQLPMGVCFTDPDGRVILCNNRMRRLSFFLGHHEWQLAADLERALAHPDPAVTVKDGCYILSDQTVWQFHMQNITVDGDPGWQQTTAHNVTDLYNGNRLQEKVNRELQEVNRKLQKMYVRMADDIREKESLDLKIHIHDTIGRSLLTIRDMINSGEDAGGKIEALREAVGVLSGDRITPGETMDAVKQTAKALGVRLQTEGCLPPDSLAGALTVAAARECVTNCIRHAGGSEVWIRIEDLGDRYCIAITNNGAVPDGPIREGSGLSSLRRSIEAAGGEMHTAYTPRFALLLTIPGKEKDV